MAKRRPKNPDWYSGPRVFAHPEKEALIHGAYVFEPGDEVFPGVVPQSMFTDWWKGQLLIAEDAFKMYFPKHWNRKHPKDRVKEVDLNPELKLGDDFTGDVHRTRTVTEA